MTSRIVLFLTLIACGLYIVCSNSNDDSGTGPETPDTPSDSTFTISQQADDARAQSGSISASTGGTLSATDASGVTYTLTVPAHSLASSAYLTLTPLQSFTVAGAVTLGSGIPTDSTCVWLAGLLCEPIGLVFDSGAVLTITLTDSIANLLDTTAFMAYVNDTAGIMYGLDCTYDTLTSSFTSTITHFSDYVLVDVSPEPDPCDLLQAAYYPQHSAALYTAGTEMFVFEVLRLYEMKHGNIRREPYFGTVTIPCPAFNSLVDGDVAGLIATHWQRLQPRYPNNTFNDVSDLVHYVEQLRMLEAFTVGTVAATTLEQTLDAMRLFIDGKLRALGTQGNQLCQDDMCSEGRTMLENVYSYGAQGWIITPGGDYDSAYMTQLESWIEDCCNDYITATISIPVTNHILRYGIDPDEVAANLYNYVCSLEVHVTLPSGTPAVGRSVRLFRNDETSHFSNFTTNDDGIAAFTLRPSESSYGCDSTSITWQIRADAYSPSTGEWTDAENSVTVTFVSELVTTTIDYQFEYDWSNGDNYNHWTATLSGNGTGPAKNIGYCAAACDGKVNRTWQGANTYWDSDEQATMVHSWNTAGPDSVYACRAIVEVHTQSIGGHSIPFLYGATVSLGDAIFAGLIYESNTGGLDTIQYGLTDCIWPEEPLYFYATESGVIGDTIWSDEYVHPSTGGVSTATLHVTVSSALAE